MANAGSSTPKRAGKIAASTGKAQHVDLHRKILLRRDLLASASEGAFYVPFIGDGDIAVELYSGRTIYGADLDPERVATAAKRLPGSTVRVFDCDAWPFPDVEEPFALADLDSYSNPYKALVSFWQNAKLADRVVIFGTDGMLNANRDSRTRILVPLPRSGVKEGTLSQRRHQRSTWWVETVLPFLEKTLASYRISQQMHYLRYDMLYWGVVVERTASAPDLGPPPEVATDERSQVEKALYDAARSGNIPAIALWLERHPAPLPPHPPGHPTKRTPEAREIILLALKGGNTRTHSAQAAGISLDTLAKWETDDPEFGGAVQKAQAEAVLSMLEHVRAAAPKSWQAAAWFLERRYYQDYGRHDIYREADPGSLTDVDAFLRLPAATPAEPETDDH
jgi:hypothetical protein